MSIFSINYSQLWEQITPPILRQPKELALGRTLIRPIQYLRDLIFDDYVTGSTYQMFDVSSAYTSDNRVIYTDRGVYENLTGSTGVYPTDTLSWRKINDSYIGATERSQYNAQKYLYEFGLNRFFQLTGITNETIYSSANTNIYIENIKASSQSFIMGGQSGLYSSDMFYTTSSEFMFNGLIAEQPFDYIIWVPDYIYTGVTCNELIVRSFADTLNIAGMRYSVSGYT